MVNKKNTMAVYVISLSDAVARRDVFFKRFSNEKYPPTLVMAINGKSIQADKYFSFIKRYQYQNGRLITPSELGCTLSHIKALEAFLESPVDNALILEDDVVGTGDDILKISKLAERMSGNAVLICGGQEGLMTKKFITGRLQEGGLVKVDDSSVKHIWRTCAYMVTRQSAHSIVECHRNMVCLADDWGIFAYQKKITYYYAQLIKHPLDLSDSAIQGERAEFQSHWCSYLQIKKKAIILTKLAFWHAEKFIKIVLGSRVIK